MTIQIKIILFCLVDKTSITITEIKWKDLSNLESCQVVLHSQVDLKQLTI